ARPPRAPHRRSARHFAVAGREPGRLHGGRTAMKSEPTPWRAIVTLAQHEFADTFRHPAPILARCLTLPVYVFALTAPRDGVRKGVAVEAGFPTLAYFLFTQTILDGWLNRFAIASLMTGFESALLRPLSWCAQGAAQAFGRTAAQLVFIGALV